MNKGFITLHRKITDWEWYDDANTFRVFMHLLLSVNWQPKKWRGRVIERGQIVIGVEKFGAEIKLSRMATRVALSKLEKSEIITIEGTNRFTLVTVINYGFYQSQENTITNSITNKQPTDNQQITNKQPQLNNITIKQYNKGTKDSSLDGSREPGTTPRKVALVDEELLWALEANPAYEGINIRKEYGKMQAWLLTPRGKGKQPSKQRFINWLNRALPEDHARQKAQEPENWLDVIDRLDLGAKP